MAASSNALLRSLPEDEFFRLGPQLLFYEAPPGRVLENPNEPVTSIYFPTFGVISIVCQLEERVVEVATIGSEGFTGFPVLLGGQSWAFKAFGQIGGEGYRVEAATFQQILAHAPALQSRLRLYGQYLFHQISQASACNRVHSILQRCARWLLMTHDRVSGDRFGLTQEYLGEMLGVRRPQVNRAARTLFEAGYIRYSRGHIQIVDRTGLESVSCACYRSIRQEYVRLLGEP